MRISKGKTDPVWIRHLPARQSYFLHPQFSVKTHGDFTAQPWGTHEPWAPSRLPFISSRIHLFRSHGGSVCIYAAKLFCSKAVWCKRKAAVRSSHTYLKNGADGICAGFSHLAWLKYLNLDPLEVVSHSKNLLACWPDLWILTCSNPSDPVPMAFLTQPSGLHA